MEKEVTLVTAFFDIGRKDFKTIPRTNEQYLDYFRVWAKMKNKLIVYTNSEMAKEVKKEREKWGLLDRTVIIEINDETKLEPDIFEKMKRIGENSYFLNYRMNSNAVSNNAHYDYIMLLKYWCLANAVEKKYIDYSEMVAWIDFGFNHGNACYENPEEFNFLWKTQLEDKIHLFTLGEVTSKPIFHLVRTLEDSIMGSPILLPASLCQEFWQLIRLSMETMLDIGFIDDDQLIVLMAYRKKKDIFMLHKSDWFMPLKEHGASHLTVKEKVKDEKSNFIRKLRVYYYNKKRLYEYIKRVKKDLK